MKDKYTKRFWGKVAIGDPHECWEWTAGKSRGYGSFHVGKRGCLPAQRVSWEITFGTIPSGMFVCHHCDNRACCNPYHLFLGTNADNMADMVAKNRQYSGPKNRGETNANSKFTEDDIPAIRAMLKDGVMHAEIARHYGVSKAAIGNISSGRRWEWLQ